MRRANTVFLLGPSPESNPLYAQTEQYFSRSGILLIINERRVWRVTGDRESSRDFPARESRKR
jgi:hypothetical protein